MKGKIVLVGVLLIFMISLLSTCAGNMAAATQGLTTIWAFPVVGFYSTATPAKN